MDARIWGSSQYLMTHVNTQILDDSIFFFEHVSAAKMERHSGDTYPESDAATLLQDFKQAPLLSEDTR